jgi:hypothetical protein
VSGPNGLGATTPETRKVVPLTLPQSEAAAPTPASLSVASLRLSQDFEKALSVEKHLVTVPVRKPTRTEWFRVHPEWAVSPLALICLKEERETYAVAPSVAAAAAGEYGRFTLFPGITRQGTFFLWPVRVPGSTGRSDRWSESAYEAAIQGRTSWTRLVANMHLGAYEIFTAKVELPEPEWPTKSLDDIVTIAFRGMVIDDVNHPVLRRLRGEL